MHKVRFVVVCATLLAALTNAKPPRCATSAVVRARAPIWLSASTRVASRRRGQHADARVPRPTLQWMQTLTPWRVAEGVSLLRKPAPLATRPMKGAPAPAPTVAQRGLRGTEGTQADLPRSRMACLLLTGYWRSGECQGCSVEEASSVTDSKRQLLERLRDRGQGKPPDAWRGSGGEVAGE